MQTQHIGIVSNSIQVSVGDVALAAAAIQKQVSEHLGPIWGIQATVAVFDSVGTIPVGYWPVIIQDDLDAPGADGYHEDEQGQPYSLIKADSNWTLSTSHEIIEMLVDPFGQRLASGTSPDSAIYDGVVQFLVEACDPCEGRQCSYQINGITVSDFYTPDYFNLSAAAGTRFSYTGSVLQPLQVLADGYISWFTPDGRTFQTFADGRGQLTSQPLTAIDLKSGRNLRAQVDAATPVMPAGAAYDRTQLVSRPHADASAAKARNWACQNKALDFSLNPQVSAAHSAFAEIESKLAAGQPWCDLYKELKSIIDGLLPLIGDLQGGALIVAGIKVLEQLCDSACS